MRSAWRTVAKRCEIRIVVSGRPGASVLIEHRVEEAEFGPRVEVGRGLVQDQQRRRRSRRHAAPRASARRCHWPPDRSTPPRAEACSGVSHPSGSASIRSTTPARRGRGFDQLPVCRSSSMRARVGRNWTLSRAGKRKWMKS